LTRHPEVCARMHASKDKRPCCGSRFMVLRDGALRAASSG